MITDKLLAFADNAAVTTTVNLPDDNGIDFGIVGDEIARTMNIVAQLDDPKAVTPTAATITPKVQGFDGTTWKDIVSFPAVSVAQTTAGERIINFAKLPLGLAKSTKLRLALTVANGPLVGAKVSAWLTPSVEA